MYYTKIRAQKHLFFSFLGYFKKAWLFQYLPFLVNKWHTHTYKLLTPTLTFACIQRSLFFRFPLFSFFVFFFLSSFLSLFSWYKLQNTLLLHKIHYRENIHTVVSYRKKMPDWRRKKISEKKNPTLTFKLKIKIRTYFFSCLAERDVLACFGERKTILFFVSPC